MTCHEIKMYQRKSKSKKHFDCDSASPSEISVPEVQDTFWFSPASRGEVQPKPIFVRH